ncbi:MAG: hypothetical protein FKY71_08880 [Spiribacter salinus]|uniref:Uncharacterized protein n=1 Tax=Spiribacter salinus TaxID=1335746 RepID=A0A540VRJ2_9GAMM|nr:MAG: hypothetical protein FKY71_08880 [Spiribacter salinus]
MSLLYGYERFIYPVEVSGAIDFTYGATSDRIIIDEQAWYCLSNANNSLSPDYPSLWDEIASELSAISGNTFRIEWATPNGYPHKEGIAIINEDQAWSLDFDSSGFDFPPEVLGFPSDISTAVSSELVGGEHVITSTQSHLGSWLPVSLDDSPTQDKRSRVDGEVYSSTSDEYEQTATTAMRELRSNRRFMLEWVPGLRIKGTSTRGRDPQYRGLCGLPEYSGSLDDDGDELAFDTFWRHCYGGGEFVVVYHDGRAEIAPGDDITEVCRFTGDVKQSPVNAYGEPMRMNGEFYSLDFDMFVVEGRYDY